MHMPAGILESGIPTVPASWYFVCRCADLRSGRKRILRLPGGEVVVFRGQSGRVSAVHARCTHLGAHLGQGDVVGDGLRCAMHHRMFVPEGASGAGSRGCLRQAAYPVVERCGGVFMFAGPASTFDFPWPGDDQANFTVVIGRPQAMSTSWAALVSNAFDEEHMRTVHRRAMKGSPQAEIVNRRLIQLRYASRVTGTGLSDTVMKKLSGDTINVTIRCWGGTLLGVRSEVGSLVNHLLLCFTPMLDGTAGVTPIFAVPPAALPLAARLRAHVTRWLFTTFLRRDLVPLEGMQFNLAKALRAGGPLQVCAQWLAQVEQADMDGQVVGGPRTLARMAEG